jgi:hypothetical protein
MQNHPPQFVVESIGGCAVSKDGSEVTIEFEGGGSLLWVTLPASLLPQMQMITRQLDAMATDARNGVAKQWHLPAQDQA